MQDEQKWQDETADQYQVNVPSLDPVNWTASEFVSHQKTVAWYIVLGAMSAVVTLVVYLISRDILSAVVVVLSCIALGVFAARSPRTKTFEINDRGVLIDSKFYPFEMFKSFSVVDDEAVSCIWLRPLKKMMPTLVMYYAPDDEEKIVLMLDNFLPQEDRQHDILDKVSRRIRF
ncbi:MAG: hypothetical protein WCJ60_00390 [bacterium]